MNLLGSNQKSLEGPLLVQAFSRVTCLKKTLRLLRLLSSRFAGTEILGILRWREINARSGQVLPSEEGDLLGTGSVKSENCR